jgi:hypothetical protein
VSLAELAAPRHVTLKSRESSACGPSDVMTAAPTEAASREHCFWRGRFEGELLRQTASTRESCFAGMLLRTTASRESCFAGKLLRTTASRESCFAGKLLRTTASTEGRFEGAASTALAHRSLVGRSKAKKKPHEVLASWGSQNPAATYSPTGRSLQYHWRGKA